jgi:ATP-dependent exoDNAse (exonuclease V) beta subunit
VTFTGGDDTLAEVDPTGRYRLAYVAMTRATDRLIVTVSGEGEIGRAIQAADR